MILESVLKSTKTSESLSLSLLTHARIQSNTHDEWTNHQIFLVKKGHQILPGSFTYS